MENTNEAADKTITFNDELNGCIEDHKDDNYDENLTTKYIDISQNINSNSLSDPVTSCSNTHSGNTDSIHDYSESCSSTQSENDNLVSDSMTLRSVIQSDSDPVDVESLIKKCYVVIPPLPSKYLSQLTKTEKFVTEDEIAESLKKKEEIDSLEGSHISGTISQISGSLKVSKIDSTLDALMRKKNSLINSIKSMLTTNDSLNSSSAIKNTLNDSTVSAADVTCVSAKSNIVTSTPFRESKPPAARFLKNWKPSFLSEDFLVVDEIGYSEDEEKDNDYEKAIESLKEVLQDTEVDTTSKLDSYSHMLDTFKEQDNKKFHEMISSIALDRETFDEVLEITSFSEDDGKSKTSNDSVIWLDSQNNTMIAINESTTNENTVVNSQTEKNTTSHENSPSINVAENGPITVTPKSESLEPKTIASTEIIEENIPRENDPDILIIEGDEDFEINVDEEDLLLASDDEEKMPEDFKKDCITPIARKKLDFFVSTDPDENRDNNDPNWNSFRNLESDYDKYKVVQARWKNLEIPNPKKDLTCRCKNTIFSNNARPTFYKNNSRKRPHSPDLFPGIAKKPRNEMCSMIFDRNINKLLHDIRNKRFNLEKEQQEALTHLAEIQQMEKMILQKSKGSKFEWKKLEEKHFKETEECIREYRRRGTKIMDVAQAELEALRKASEEIRQFHEFYPTDGTKNGKNSLISLTETEVQEILEVEEMVLSFTTFYNA